MVKKILLVLVLLPFLVLALSPKKELFYLLEKRLANQGIVLSGGTMDAGIFGLSVEHPTVYFKGIKVATVDELSIVSVLFWTRVSAERIVVDSALHAYAPPKIDRVQIHHQLLAPTEAAITIDDPQFGGTGSLDLSQRHLRVLFPKLPAGAPAARYLKRTKGGWVYEQQI